MGNTETKEQIEGKRRKEKTLRQRRGRKSSREGENKH
jgi:hypothetical protein